MCIWPNEWISPKTLRDNQVKYYRPHEAEWKESPGGSSGIRGTNKSNYSCSIQGDSKVHLNQITFPIF